MLTTNQEGASEDMTVEKLEGVGPGHYLVPAETVVMKWVDRDCPHDDKYGICER